MLQDITYPVNLSLFITFFFKKQFNENNLTYLKF